MRVRFVTFLFTFFFERIRKLGYLEPSDYLLVLRCHVFSGTTTEKKKKKVSRFEVLDSSGVIRHHGTHTPRSLPRSAVSGKDHSILRTH